MLYTIIPIEDVLEGLDESPPPTVDVAVHGVLLQVEPLTHFSGRVQRLISSDPQAYLNPQYQPGTILHWT